MTQKPLDESEVPLEAIVEPAPMLEAVEPDALPPETAIIEHVQLETPEAKPAIAIVDVEPELTPPTEPMLARRPVAEIEAAAEKIANDIKQDADQIQASLRTESAARAVDARSPESRKQPKVVIELSKTLPEIAAGVMKFAARAFRSAAEIAVEKINERRSTEAPASPEAVALATVEEKVTDTQARSDAIASWVGEGGALQSPGENINVSDQPNEVVEGMPKPDETEFSAMDETAVQPDDLTVIEGIGPKVAAALSDAGIDTFARLAGASDDELRAAIHAGGIRLAPTLATWAQQAAYAERGDWEGLKEFQQSLSNR